MIPQPVKDFLNLLLGVLLPILYVVLKTKFPDFPLSQDTFMNVILWAIGLLIGGWSLSNLIKKYVV